MLNNNKKYNVIELDENSTSKIYGGWDIFEYIGCRTAEIIHNYFHDQPVKAVHIKQFAEHGNNYA